MIITISGVPGSGKTTVGKEVARILGYRFCSMGDMRGEMATERGVTVEEINRMSRDDPFFDRALDDYQRNLGRTKDRMVIESRLSWHFIPGSVKIYLDADPKTASERIFKDQREDEDRAESPEQIEKAIRERANRDREWFMKKYGVDIEDRNNFDYWIDTTGFTKKQVIEKVLSAIRNHGK
jgi:cytidylate kinase